MLISENEFEGLPPFHFFGRVWEGLIFFNVGVEFTSAVVFSLFLASPRCSSYAGCLSTLSEVRENKFLRDVGGHFKPSFS